MRHLFVSFAAAITLTGCVPDTGTGRGTSSGSQTSCSIIRPSAPYGIKGPNPDGANFYRFTVRADGEVTCTGKVAQIGVTVVLHHSTNGVAGAHTVRRRCVRTPGSVPRTPTSYASGSTAKRSTTTRILARWPPGTLLHKRQGRSPFRRARAHTS